MRIIFYTQYFVISIIGCIIFKTNFEYGAKEVIYLILKFQIDGSNSAYFLNPLIEDYLEFFDTPAPVHSNYTQEKEKRKEKGGRKTVFKRRRLVISSK